MRNHGVTSEEIANDPWGHYYPAVPKNLKHFVETDHFARTTNPVYLELLREDARRRAPDRGSFALVPFHMLELVPGGSWGPLER